MRLEFTTEEHRRFEAKVDRSGGPNACHPWIGGLVNGYGQFWAGDHYEFAHRVAWVLAGNEITENKPCILHDCPRGDNSACCNVRHLWAGTKADNNRDMAAKGRGRVSRRGLPFGASIDRSGRFISHAQIDGKVRHLGTYDTAEEASAVALEAKHQWLDRVARGRS